MPDLSALLAQRGQRGINAAVRAVRAWQRIQDRATTITVYRGNPAVAQTAQVVRVEFDSTTARVIQQAGQAAQQGVILFGVRDHPDNDVSDTDLKKGDRVMLADGNYQVISVIDLPGEIQARAERLS